MTMLLRPALLVLVLACVRAKTPRKANHLTERPEWLSICKRSDPQLNQCMKDGLQKMYPALVRGIPEVDLEKFEPLFIKTIGVTKGHGAVMINGALEDLLVYGPINATFTDVVMDLKNNKWQFQLAVPYLRLESRYNIKGNILLLPVVGAGGSTIHLRECSCHASCEIKMQEVEGREIINVTHMDVDFKVAGMRLHLNNLFNGNKVLGQTMNQFLNKNALSVIDELKEDIGKALSEVFRDILNKAFSHLPTDLWLPKD